MRKSTKTEKIKMEALRFHKTVDKKGKIILAKLPPGKIVDVIVLFSDDNDFKSDMRALMEQVRSKKRFDGMSKDEIVQKLRKDRDEIAEKSNVD